MVPLSLLSWVTLDSLNTLLFFVAIFLLIPELINKKNITISIISSIVLGIIDIYFTNAALLLIIFIYLELFRHPKVTINNNLKFIILLTSFFISSITQGIANYAVVKLFNLPLNTYTFKSILSIILLTIINYILTIAIILGLKKLNKLRGLYSILNNKSIIKVILLSITVITVSYLSLSLISRYQNVQLTYFKVTILITVISIISVTIGSSFLIIGYIKELKSNYESKSLVERNLYIKELERKNTELRRFKHDYKNLLASLSVSLKSNNSDNNSIQDLLDYADSNIDITSTIKNTNLYHLNDNLVKGIIVTKLVEAESKHIKTDFEIDQNILIPKPLSVEITRILGILFDNAIEASLLAKNSKIDFALVSFDDYLEFIIKNSIDSTNKINLDQISKIGYTTKNGHNGIGLSTVDKIIHTNSNLLLQTKIEKDHFSTILTVLQD